MHLTDHILFLLAGLGVVNALLLAGYCGLVLAKKNWHNWLLAGLLLALSIRIGKSILYAFYDLDRWVLQLGLSACIFIGPFLWLYLRAIRGNDHLFARWGKLHLMGPLLSIITIGLVWPYETHPWAWNHRVVYFIYAVWGGYLLHAIYLHRILLTKLWQPRNLTTIQGWTVLLLLTMGLLYTAYTLALFGFPYLVGPLLFSIIFYLLFAYILLSANGKQIFVPNVANTLATPKLASRPNPQLANSNDGNNSGQEEPAIEDQATLLAEVVRRIGTEQLYLNPTLKLHDLAEKLALTPHELSRCINVASGRSFNHFINRFRVKAACELLASQHHLTIEGIGQEAGFASRSAFYRAFKQEMEQTPAMYKARHLPGDIKKLS